MHCDRYFILYTVHCWTADVVVKARVAIDDHANGLQMRRDWQSGACDINNGDSASRTQLGRRA